MKKEEIEVKNKDTKSPKRSYKAPTIKTESIEEANATAMGGGSTCNGSTSGGRKDNAGSGCTTLLT